MLDAVSTWYSGAELDRVSARDLERYVDTGVNWRVVEGYGSVIAAHGADLRIELGCRVERVDHRGRELRIETSRGAVTAQAALVTLPTPLIVENENFFLPALPEKARAAAGLPLGLAGKLFLALSDAETFDPDSRAFGAYDRTATAAYQFRPLGRPLIECYFGGALAAELEKGGEAAFTDFAVTELVGLFGADFARRVAPRGSHQWGADPLSRGSYSYALPGRADDRAVLAAPVDDRILFCRRGLLANRLFHRARRVPHRGAGGGRGDRGVAASGGACGELSRDSWAWPTNGGPVPHCVASVANGGPASPGGRLPTCKLG